MKLGIPITTRHNEVAPNQFECAPMFEEANQAVDNNSLLMDLMGRIAKKHDFKVLLHEKPFAGVNGSGKHNNWSLSTDTGENLLSPGKNPQKHLQFLSFFVNTIKKVSELSRLRIRNWKYTSLISVGVKSVSFQCNQSSGISSTISLKTSSVNIALNRSFTSSNSEA